MKHILILLIIISFALGQDIEISLTPGVSLTNAEIRLHQLITFDNILDYAEECYNDSTWVTVDLYNRSYEMFSHYTFGILDYENAVVRLHRTPTFEGFVEWLERSK